MQDKIDFLRRAKVDLKISKNILNGWSDEIEIDASAYHLQQALEKAMKHEITLLGEDYPRTHEIKRLWSSLDSLGKTPPEWIWENRALLTDYADKTRYGENLVAVERELREFIALLEEYIKSIEDSISVLDGKFSPKEVFKDFGDV